MKHIDVRASLLQRNQTRSRINLILLSGIPLIVLVLIAAGVSSFDYSRRLSEARHWVLHTYEVMQQLDALLSAPTDAESGAYGLLLTRDSEYLKDFTGTRGRAFQALQTVSELTHDNPDQQQRLMLLKPVLEKQFECLESVTKLQPHADRNLVEGINGTQERQTMNELRTLVAQLRTEEQHLLASRLASLKQIHDDLMDRLMVCGVIAIGGFLFVGVAVRYIMKLQDNEYRLQQVVYSVSQILDSPHNPERVMDEVLEFITCGLEWQFGELWSLDETGERLILECNWKPAGQQFEHFEAATENRSFPLGVGLPGRVWKSREVTWIADVVEDSNFPRASQAKLDNLHGAIAFPLLLGDEVQGVMAFFTSRVLDKIDDAVIDTLSVVGQQIARHMERQRIGKSLQASERKFKAIFDSTFEFIGMLDTDGTLIEVNKTALDFIMLPKEAVVGKPFWETPWWTHDAGLQKKLQIEIEAAASGKFVRFESEHYAPDGAVVHVDFSVKPVYDEEGKIVLLIPEGRDISDKKEADKRVSEFYSTVSHELRTPLTSIRGALGLLEGGKGGELSAKAKSLVTMGRIESERLVRLINDILDIRKIEAGKFELHIEKIVPAGIIETTIETLIPFASESNVKLVKVIQDQSPISGDKDRLVQVLTNLVSNAVKFSPAGSEVLIRAIRDGDTFRTEVIDNGPGIQEKDLSKLFQMFQQVDSSDTREKGGTGLGLAISKAIVERHDGKIGVESVFGKGSTFWFEIPVHEDHKTGVHQTFKDLGTALLVENADGHNAHDRKPGPARILIVEDDDTTREIIKQHISSVSADIVCVEATDGQQAIELTREHEPDLIILDLGLPTTDGFEVVTVLRQEKAGRTPLIVYTARDLSEEEKRKLTLGLTTHFTKSKTTEASFVSCLVEVLDDLISAENK